MIQRVLIVSTVVLAFAGCGGRGGDAALASAGTLSALVDNYLDEFARRHPSIAAGNGLHDHDGALEDFSAGAVKAEVEWLTSTRERLEALDPAPLSPDARVDRRILLGVIDGWLLDLDTVRTWT